MPAGERLEDYLAALGAKSGTPGGGAAAAVTAAQGAALVAMVCRFTRNQSETTGMVTRADDARERFVHLAERDAQCFEAVMTAWRLPDEQRSQKLQPALKDAAEVPLEVLELAASFAGDLERLAEIGNRNLITDTGIAANLFIAAIDSSRLNVLINVRGITDEQHRSAIEHRLTAAAEPLRRLGEVARAVESSLAPQ